MKLKKISLMLSLILLSSIITSCAQIPDVPICKELSPDRGYCSYTLSPKSRDFYIDEEHPYKGQTWWEMRPIMMQVPPSSWAEIKKYIIKQCRIAGNCRSDVGEWLNKITPNKNILDQSR